MKLDGLPQVSHTTVLKAKENHLASKVLKTDLHKLANRRLGRAQDVATERVIAIVSLWAKRKYSCDVSIIILVFRSGQETNIYSLITLDEESVAMEEVKALGEAVQEVELSVRASDVDRNFDDFSYISVKKEESKKESKRDSSKGIGSVNRTLML